jgi:autotransporter-associated beta strand protein
MPETCRKPALKSPLLSPGFCSGRNPALLLAFCCLAGLWLLAASAHAATRTWSGGAPLLNNWTIAANWSGGVAPVAGDNLVFPLGAARMTNVNNFPAGTAFGSITFQRGGYVITGNALSPSSINATHLAGTTTILADLTPAAAMTLNATGFNPSLVVSNLFGGTSDVTVTGSGEITIVGEMDMDSSADFRKTGTGRLNLDPDRSIFMDATITIDDGSVWLLETMTVDVVVNSGGTLRGGPVEYLDNLESNGGIVAPGTEDHGSIRVFDSVNFDAATTFRLRLAGQYDYDYLGLSLTVPTTLSLGGCQLDLEVAPTVELGQEFFIVDPSNPGSVITGTFAGHPEGSRFTEDGFTFEITYQGGEHSNSVVLTVVNVPATGVAKTWSGAGGDSNWSTAANWVGNIAPVQGDDLVFPPGVARYTNSNNFSSGWSFNSILFSGSNYVTSGNQLLLSDGFTSAPLRGTNHFGCALKLSGAQAIRFGLGTFATLSGSIDNAGHDLTLAGAGSGEINGPVLGAGQLIKLGAGAVALASSNSFGGLTLVSNGVLVVTHANALGADTAHTLVTTNASLKVQGGVDLIERLRLAGSLISDLGTNKLGGGATLLETNVTFRVEAGSELVVTSPLSGAGGFVKTGVGRMTTRGPQPFSGKAAVQAGALFVHGFHSNSVITLDGGLLGGSGYAGGIRGLNGIVSPGSSPGRLGADDVRMEAATLFDVEINGAAPGPDYDQLQLDGVVTISDAVLRLTRSYLPTEADRFTIIDNRGQDEVFGTFLNLPEGAVLTNGGVRFEITYLGGDGNDVVLRRLMPPPLPCPEPVLSIRLLTNEVELSWPNCPSNFYQIAWTTNFNRWDMLTPPLAAPPSNRVMTWTTPTALPHQFFQLIVRPLIDSAVPTNGGIYPARTLVHGGIARSYRLNIPLSITNGQPAPLMFALHGHNMTADSFAGNTPALANYANEAGVILVYPNGTDDENGTGWNTLDPTPENPVDDVGFLLALIDELDASLNIDRKRIYAGGFSNGGKMCHFLGSRTTNVFAAFAAVGSAVGGQVGGVEVFIDPPLEPRPVMIVNATNDCKRPFRGGVNDDGVLQSPAFAQVTHWTNGNACVSAPIISTNVVVTNHINRVFASCGGPYPPFNAPKTNLVIREHYQLGCAPGAEVQFVTLTDGGHAWVEAADNVGFDTSREVLEFFLRHCRCDVAEAALVEIPTAPGQHEFRFCDQGYSRLVRLQIPAGYNPAVAAPLAFVFHGGQQTVAEFGALHPALFTKANAENMLLVLPQATIHPQSRDTLWGDRPFDVVVDDRSFFTNLLEHLDATLNVDRLRVYGTGFSNGGEFCNWLAASQSGYLAAIAPVCAQTGWNEPDASGPIVAPPAPLEPIAVLMVRGGLDPKRPFNGGLNIDGVECRSASDDASYWSSGNLCAGAPVVTSAPGIMRWQQAACSGTTETTLVRVDALGHAWPDAPPFNANVNVIDFLLSHSR